MLDLETAQQRILACLPAADRETVPLSNALDRFLVELPSAMVDLPPFDNSAVDGFAIRAAEVESATRETPVALRLIDRVAAGDIALRALEPQTCIRLFTGSPLPPAADAVVMQEDIQSSAQDNVVHIVEPVRPWENVRFRAEDVVAGSKLGRAGERIGAGHLALFAASGVSHVVVGRRPLVALVATGSELRRPGEILQPGQIYESNRIMLEALARQSGTQTRVFDIVADDPAETEQVMGQAFDECDLVVSAGGVSVGEFDFVKAAVVKLGGELEFWKVAIKPGKPFVFGRCRNKFFFGLPGNPVSAFVTFLLLVRPALVRSQGGDRIALESLPGVLQDRIVNRGDRRHFVRVRREGDGSVRLAGTQASHLLNSLALANALVEVPPETVLEPGEAVRVLAWS